MSNNQPRDGALRIPGGRPRKHGVVAVVQREQRLLVIRRSQFVSAPGRLCFPGGAIELGESEPVALARELQEELAVAIEPRQRLWHSLTPWNVALAWWSAAMSPDAQLIPNPHEVAEVHWLTITQLRESPDLLESNHDFLDAWERRELVIGESECEL